MVVLAARAGLPIVYIIQVVVGNIYTIGKPARGKHIPVEHDKQINNLNC